MSTHINEFSLQIDAALKHIFGSNIDLIEITQLSGGSISNCLRARTSQGEYFLKRGALDSVHQFNAEADALRFLQQSSFRVPQIYKVQPIQGQVLLVLEYLPLRPVQDWTGYARRLVELHQITHSQFGWHGNNFIGATEQQNPWCVDWPQFWQQARLTPQLNWAKSKLSAEDVCSIERVIDAVPSLLAGHQPICSLVHGDLWSGNIAETIDGQPALFDPALYYGDREVDLAMSELFGGVPPSLSHSYHRLWPLDGGYETRQLIYNLYHLLNHLNIFGKSYLSAIHSLINQLRTHI